MTSNLMISMLRKGKNGAEILNILDSITSVDTLKETVLSVVMPPSVDGTLDGSHRTAGMILDWQGNEVVF